MQMFMRSLSLSLSLSLCALSLLLSLQSVAARQKETLLAKLTEADAVREALEADNQQLQQQLAAAVLQVQARSEAAASAQEAAAQELAALRQVWCRGLHSVLVMCQETNEACGMAGA
jgi:regulator of replication initiation timing